MVWSPEFLLFVNFIIRIDSSCVHVRRTIVLPEKYLVYHVQKLGTL